MTSLLASKKCEEYKNAVLFLVFLTVRENPNITINQLRHVLHVSHFISSDVVDGAIGALANSELFNSISKFTVKKKAVAVVHLHVRPECAWTKAFNEWLGSMGQVCFDPPRYKK